MPQVNPIIIIEIYSYTWYITKFLLSGDNWSIYGHIPNQRTKVMTISGVTTIYNSTSYFIRTDYFKECKQFTRRISYTFNDVKE